jgi:hypothetical protein
MGRLLSAAPETGLNESHRRRASSDQGLPVSLIDEPALTNSKRTDDIFRLQLRRIADPSWAVQKGLVCLIEKPSLAALKKRKTTTSGKQELALGNVFQSTSKKGRSSDYRGD